MKKILCAAAILALTSSASWAMPRATILPTMPQSAQTVGWLDGFFGCPDTWLWVYVAPGSGCKPSFGKMAY